MSLENCDFTFSFKATKSLCKAMDARVKLSIFESRAEYVRALIRRDLANNESTTGLTKYHIPNPRKQRIFDRVLMEKFCQPPKLASRSAVN